METARQFFSKQEVAALGLLPPDARTRAFFNCWTRKEAFVKAVGEGLSHSLDDFDVTLRPGDEPRLLELDGSTARAAGWSLFDVSPMDGWVGALAVERTEAEVHHAGWFWEPPADGKPPDG